MAIVSKGKTKKQSANSTLTTPHVAIYMRVSTEDQADRGTIDAQRDFLRKFTSLYQLPVADEYTDDGVTGTLPLGERPEGQRLLQDAEAGRFSAVLVYRMTRLGRSLKALINAHDLLSKFGVTIRSATEPFDTSTPIGTFLFQLLGSLAELDRAQILEQLAHGRDRVARSGKWIDGLIPYGYMVNEEGKLTPSTRLVETLQMTEAEVVQDLFARMAAGSSSVIEARRLNALGVPTTRYYGNGRPRAGTKWHPGPVVDIMTNTTYKGIHVYNSQYGAIDREVTKLVEPDLWERAGAQIQKNRRLPKSNATRIYLLRGLVLCGQCGRAYVGQVYTNRKGTKGSYYRCCGLIPDHYAREEKCRSKVVNTAWLEPLVWEHCQEYIRNPDETLAEAQRRLQDRVQQAPHIDQERGGLLKALAEKAQERDRITLLHRRGRISLQDAEAHMDDITREEADLRRQCNAIDAQRALVDASAAHLTETRLMLHSLQGNLDEINRTDNRAAKRQVIEHLVQGIRIDTDSDGKITATIDYTFGPACVVDSSTRQRDSIRSRA